MGYVVTFLDFTPTKRFDTLPWTDVRIEEADQKAGPFTTIDTQALDPIDVDPTDPSVRNLTTEEATLESGWYRVVFVDANGDEQPTQPIYHQVARDNFLPTVSEVGSLLRARTKSSTMQELGTFTDDTRPTQVEVERIIDKAAYNVATKIGTEIPEETWEMAGFAIAIRAAMLVELSYFPEQVRSDKSAYSHYRDLYKDTLSDLAEAVKQASAGGFAGPVDDTGNPEYAFPEDQGGMVGWGTTW